MKLIIFLFFITILMLFSGCNVSNDNTGAVSYNATAEKMDDTKSLSAKDNLVLVELFTSEGCSSCPPADKALAKLKSEQPVENAEIITLAFHVDYWDYLGWKDEFSNAKFSQRQAEYTKSFQLKSNYTPQMIVDGKYEFVGSKYSNALKNIGKASETEKADVEIKINKELINPSLKVKISNLDTKEDSDIWLAITEDNLKTDVKRGENSGRNLSHMSVVRSFQQLGYVATGEKEFAFEKSVKLNAKWKENDLNFVIFAQNKNSKNIVAIGKTKFE